MASTPSAPAAIVGMKCPRCRQGDLFPTSSFSFDQPFMMYEHCPACAQPYFPEPGFYYGAMFISYIGSGFFCLGFVMLLHWVFGWSTAASFALLLVVVGLLFVWWFRFARTLYIHLVVRFQPGVAARVARGEMSVAPPAVTNQN